MDHLSATDRDVLRGILLAQRDACGARMDATVREVTGGDGVVPDPGDRQDRPSSDAAARAGLAISERDRERLVRIDAALKRMDDGAYGICAETGEPIPFARLQIEPTTRYTVDALVSLEDNVDPEDRDNDDDHGPY